MNKVLEYDPFIRAWKIDLRLVLTRSLGHDLSHERFIGTNRALTMRKPFLFELKHKLFDTVRQQPE